MDSSDKSTLLITGEFILGITFSIFFIKYIFSNDDFWGKDYFTGIIRVFGSISLIFFFSVFSVGIVGAILLKQKDRIAKAILYSILFWLLSLIICVFCATFLGIFSLFIILIAIVIGFNYGLKKEPFKEEPY